jgi:hypothetical protein
MFQSLSLSLLLLACSAAAQDQATASQASAPVFVHPLTNMPPASDDVETAFIYPAHSNQNFPIGETVTVLCHFTNTAQHNPLNVTAIMGSLNSPFDFNFHVQNYSYKPLGVVVRPDEEFTFSYEFQVSACIPSLPPLPECLLVVMA